MKRNQMRLNQQTKSKSGRKKEEKNKTKFEIREEETCREAERALPGQDVHHGLANRAAPERCLAAPARERVALGCEHQIIASGCEHQRQVLQMMSSRDRCFRLRAPKTSASGYDHQIIASGYEHQVVIINYELQVMSITYELQVMSIARSSFSRVLPGCSSERVASGYEQQDLLTGAQGYLAHKKQPTP